MFGASLTLIVLTSQRLARIDLAGPRGRLRVQRAVSCPAIASSELASAVAIAFRLGEPTAAKPVPMWQSSRRPRSIVVLSDDVWNDSITLPLDVTVLLQPAEIQQALAIEAQNFSGISAFNSSIAVKKLVDASSKLLDASSNLAADTTWWLAQVAHSDLAKMASAAQVCGAVFLGATHTQSLWRTGGTDSHAIQNLGEPSELMRFGEQWARALSQDGFELLVRPAPVDTKRQRLGWLQTSAALATTMVCAGVYQLRTAQWNTTDAELKQQQQYLAEFDATARQLRVAEAQWQKSRPKVPPADIDRPQPVLVNKPARPTLEDNPNWLALFDALTNDTPEDCWIESWGQSEHHPLLAGRALTAQAIHELASRLEQSLWHQGWQVSPPVIHPGESELLKFELPLQPRSQSATHQTLTQPAKPAVTTPATQPATQPAKSPTANSEQNISREGDWQ